MKPFVSSGTSISPAHPLSGLSREILHATRTAPLPVNLRELFESLPDPIGMTAVLGGPPSGWPLSVRQLLRMSLVSDHLVLQKVSLVEIPAAELTLSRKERTWIPDARDLEAGIQGVIQGILGTLLSLEESSELLNGFAFLSSHLSTLSTITRFMLQSTNEDQALYILLSGITSGYSLGFNRAALFVWDEHLKVFAGSKGIGPFDETEAHRIWEAIEIEEKDIAALIRDYDCSHFDTRFQQLVQDIRLVPEPDDEIWQALGAQGPILVRQEKAINEGLCRLDVRGEFVLASLRPHGRTLGLVLADNRHNREPVTQDRLRHLAFFIDQTALVWENLALLRRVEELARVDGLTGVFNRREFENRLKTELARSQRHGRPCSLLVVDVDHFKQINDTRGHEAGDVVLRQVAKMLRDTTRADDVVGRYGGDEFVVMLPEADPGQLRACGIRIGTLAAEAGISLSIGGACWPVDCETPDELFHVADGLLYQAKSLGRGRVCIPGFEPFPFG